MGLVTGPLWGRKAWGVWWQWDAKLTIALLLELTLISAILVRKYGGPGSDKLAAAIALFGIANVPFVYESVNIWRTMHPMTTVVPTLPRDAWGILVLRDRVHAAAGRAADTAREPLLERQATLDELFLAEED